MNNKQVKKLRRIVKRAYPSLYDNLGVAILELPLKKRLKIAWLIILKRKLIL